MKGHNTISDIIPQIQFLKHFIKKASSDEKLSDLESTLFALCSENRFKQYTDNYNIILAAFLDLRYKSKFFKERDFYEETKLSKKNFALQLKKSQEIIKSMKPNENNLTNSSDGESESELEQKSNSTINECKDILELDFDNCVEELQY